jgi:hypothetical protein
MLTKTTIGAETRPTVRVLDVDSRDPFALGIATTAHTPSIDSLRQKSYASAGYFSLPDPRTVRRENDLPHAITLIVANKRELAATVRLTYARDRKQVEAILEGSADVSPSYFPTMTICRGATDPKFRGLGLMAFLVSVGVAVARQAGLGSALAMQAEGTPHYPAMRAAGWNSRPVEGDRMNTVKLNAAMTFVYIDRERFGNSVSHSERVHNELHQRLEVPRVVLDAATLIAKARV